ncbi:MAG: nitrilase family protein [Muribaculaceae bacterium]|nr:nitrilase family protein [Muribaculaceae bacterium]
MLNRNFNIALIESNITWGDKEANLKQLRNDINNLDSSVDLIVLPEMFSTGFITDDKDKALELAERNSGDTMRMLHDIASERQTAICGSFLASTAGQVFNRAFFIEPNGDDTFYDKRHLFAFGGEDKVYHQGHTQAPIVRFRGMNIKLVVCYDLRFPVFCRTRKNDYDIMVVVANWPTSRQRVWNTLLTARAMENECYVCGVNRRGTDEAGVAYGSGSSVIIDFKGKTVAQTSEQSPIAAASLSPEALDTFRTKFPAWRDADDFTLHI